LTENSPVVRLTSTRNSTSLPQYVSVPQSTGKANSLQMKHGPNCSGELVMITAILEQSVI
jgi:hypothetical protein